MEQKTIVLISIVVVAILAIVGIAIGIGVYFYFKNKKKGRGINKTNLVCLFDAANGSSLGSDRKTITDLSSSGQNATIDKGTITLNSGSGGYFTIPAGSNVYFNTSKLPIGRNPCTILTWVRVSSLPSSGSANTCALYGADSTSGTRSIYFGSDGGVVIGASATGLNFQLDTPKVKPGVWTLLGYSFTPGASSSSDLGTFTAYTYDLSSKEIKLTPFNEPSSSGFTTLNGSTGFLAYTADLKSVEMDIALFAIYSSVFSKDDFSQFIKDSNISAS